MSPHTPLKQFCNWFELEINHAEVLLCVGAPIQTIWIFWLKCSVKSRAHYWLCVSSKSVAQCVEVSKRGHTPPWHCRVYKRRMLLLEVDELYAHLWVSACLNRLGWYKSISYAGQLGVNSPLNISTNLYSTVFRLYHHSIWIYSLMRYCIGLWTLTSLSAVWIL